MKTLKKLFVFAIALCCAAPAFANLTFPITATGSTAGQVISAASPKVLTLVSITATGTWGGTTITVQKSADGGTTWIDTGVSLTANGEDFCYIRAGDQVRVTATGGTGINLVVLIRS